MARPSLIHTAEFPLSSAPALRRVVGVYWRHQVAGHVVRRTRGTETILVEIHLKPGYARRAPGTDLRLFRGRRDPAVTWIAMVPRN